MRRLPLVDRLRVRAPCEVGWENMEDLGTHRHCAKCESTVHDVAAMTRAEVETLLEARERGERVCLHLHVRRSDGAVLVADGFVERAGRRPPSRMVAAAMATATAMSACTTATSPPRDPQSEIAIAPVAPAPIETAPPPAPPPPALPPPLPPVEEPLPITAPVTTPVTTPLKPARSAKPPKKIAVPSARPAPPPKKPPHLDIIDGGAW